MMMRLLLYEGLAPFPQMDHSGSPVFRFPFGNPSRPGNPAPKWKSSSTPIPCWIITPVGQGQVIGVDVPKPSANMRNVLRLADMVG